MSDESDPKLPTCAPAGLTGPLILLPINLELHSHLAVQFRVDSFIASFGSAVAFFGPDGDGADRYIAWLKQGLFDFQGFAKHAWNNSIIVGQYEAGIAHYDRKEGTIYLIYIAPAFRGRGWGAALLQHAENYLLELGASVLKLRVSPSNQVALELYRNCGWSETSTQLDSEGLVRLSKTFS